MDPDPNVANRDDVLRIAAKATGVPLPEGLIVDVDQVRDLLKPLQLNDDQHLAQALFEAAGRYLRPRHQAFVRTSVKQTKKHLGYLLAADQHLEKILTTLLAKFAP